MPVLPITASPLHTHRILPPPRHPTHPLFHLSNSSRTKRQVTHSSSSSSMPLHVSTSSPRQLKDDLLTYSRGFWVTRTLIAWNPSGRVEEDSSGYSYYLYASNAASLTLGGNRGVSGYDERIELQEHNAGLPKSVVEKFPHIGGYRAFEVPRTANAESLLKCQLMVAAFGPDGKCKDATGLQLPGILDELFSYDGPLGAHYSRDGVSLYLWAPTAQAVRACIYKDPYVRDPFEIVSLQEFDEVWRTTGPRDWEGCYYAYEIYVYHPSTLAVEKCYAIDPYARSLSSDCRRTLLVNLHEDSLKPAGWENLADEKPTLHSFTDISIYELHTRDFSANDQTVHPDFRGGYLAFTLEDSAGMLHLKKLSKAGITHVHLLPTFQFAGVDDVKKNWKSVGARRYLDTYLRVELSVSQCGPIPLTIAESKMLEGFPPDSPKQQALITEIQEDDAYNWGYNPVVWGVPKGSYASNPDGSSRIIEFRKMVQALNRNGHRVVMDVVYNHLHGSGPHGVNSVLDKIVPGYYLRRNVDGVIENSTCVNNTASEHYMVERLIIDDLLNWASNYKVDGFRFDLMGHIMKATMIKARDALRSLTIENDGVDGSKIFLYGEGWDFGEVANNGRGINASQFNLCGTGIGSFNDRVRDALLGGSPFGHPLQQGFITGLMLQPNGHDHGGNDAEALMLSSAKDHIQVGMAGNLRDFVLTDSEGKSVKGSEVLTYGGASVAYASQPAETINYVSAHDNETLFDVVSMKTPIGISVDERCRLNHLATSMIALSQGIPFFHAGDEMLRSKSMDRDSYNSGDWFNRLDFSYESNNWGIGLPPEGKNQRHWPLIKPRLADPSFKPKKDHILAAVQNFVDVLQIRYSSPLFRLTTANAIQERVRFHNTGPSWVPGVIVMSIEDGHEGRPGLSQLDQIYSYIVVIFNSAPTKVSFTSPAIRGRSFQLHPVQNAVQLMSVDEAVKNSSYEASEGCFVVPRMTTSVFVERRVNPGP